MNCSYKIMIVDDDPAFSSVAKRYLENDYGVSKVADGQACLDEFAEVKPDVIFLDWCMPVLTGIETLRTLRRMDEAQDTRIVIMTGLAGRNEIIDAWRAGADDFILKPFGADELLEVTKRQVAEKKIVDDIKAERGKINEQLRQVQRMESMGVLASGIAHDFNNLLFPILGYSDMLDEALDDDADEKHYVQEIRTAASRAKELVEQILFFSRQANKEKKTVEFSLIVKEALKLMRATIPTSIKINQWVKSKCDPVLGDPTQIHQIVMNLCTNAFHSMQKDGGTLKVQVNDSNIKDNVEGLDPNVEYIRLTVSDTGTGIPEKIKKRIFDPFFTTKEVGKGTGMGLSMVHGIVADMGGVIHLTSEVGRGTTFEIFLPKSRENIRPALVPAKKTQEGSEKILIVDDDVSIANMLHAVLSKVGYSVSRANSSPMALELFQDTNNGPGSFDLIITDMTMPNLTGKDLSKKILEIRPDTPIIIMPGSSDALSESEAKSVGISAYLQKPVDLGTMTSTIRDILDQKNKSPENSLLHCHNKATLN